MLLTPPVTPLLMLLPMLLALSDTPSTSVGPGHTPAQQRHTCSNNTAMQFCAKGTCCMIEQQV